MVQQEIDSMGSNESEALAMRYRDALVRLDEIHTMLVTTLRYTRIGWDAIATSDSVLDPINQLAKQMHDAIPDEIRRTL